MKNEGNVSVRDGKLADDHANLADKTFTLAPDETAEFTYTYEVTQADIDAGEIINVVKANATAERGDDPAEVSATATVTTEEAEAKLSITKEAEPTKDVGVGDTINYTVVVKNVGNVSVKDGKLSDDHADLSDKTFALAPDEEATFTYTYEVTQDDVDAGKIVNTVTANATAERGDNPAAVEATATVTAEAAASELSVTKTASPKSGVAVGDEITYTVVVKNEGNVSVKDGKLVDDHADLADKTFALKPDETAEFTYTYKVTQADIDAGKIVNVVKANATAARGDNPAEVTATATVTAEDAETELSITKTANPTAGVGVGDTVTYTVVVKNEGNVGVKDGKLVDDHADLSDKTFALAPGKTAEFTYTYEVTQADVDAGKIVNVVKANATAERGENPEEVSATATVTAEAAEAKLSVTKTADPKEGVSVGDDITYKVVVTNTGNVSVKAGTLSDDHADLAGKTFALAPGKTAEFTYTYKVKQEDVDAGSIVNVVKANATAERGDDPAEASATATVTTEAAEAKLSVSKTAKPTEGVAVGDEITYTVVVKNEGNVGVKDGALVDDHADLSDETFALAPNETAQFTYTYEVTQADVDAGSIVNVVKANATAVRGDDPEEAEATATVTTEAAAAKLSIKKTADKQGVKAGETVTYTVVVKNEGNVSVKAGKLEDDHADLSDKTFALAPGEETTFTYTYVVKQSDIDAGEFTNTVIANATAERGEDPKEVTATSTVTAEGAGAAISISKTADPTKDVEVGSKINYTVVVTNTGNVGVKEGKLADDHADLSKESFELAPGESKTFNYTYEVVQADIDAGEIVNKVAANAKAVRGTDPKEVTATATVTAKAAESRLSITKKADTGLIDALMGVGLGDTITYTVVVKNEGNVSVKEGTLADDHVDLTGKTFALAPGEEATFTYTYEVTQADLDAGQIVNVVKANATAERGANPKEVEATATVKTEAANAKLSITKAANPASGVAVGDTVTYTVVVTNSGNVSVNAGRLADDHADLTDKTFALAPGEEATFTYTYEVTQADVDAGSIVNVVKANATAARGENPKEVSATATVTAETAKAKLNITKTAKPTSGVAVGDEITYTVVVTNSGNVSVNTGKLVDDHTDLSAKTFALAPGESETFTYIYEVTQADIDAGSIVNVVKANAKAARGENPAEVEARATVTTEAAAAELSVTKAAKPTSNVKAGDTVTYTVVVTNSGNVSVKDGTLADDHADLSKETFALAPSESKTFTYTYKVTQADVDAGSFTNTVKANATAERGEDPAEVSATATVTAEAAAAELSITKTAKPTSNVKAGDTITYTVVVTNSGNVSVKNGTLADDHADLSKETFALAPSESKTFTYTYKVTQADIDAGQIVNVVKANAEAERGPKPAEVSATATVTAEKADPALTVTKTASKTNGLKANDKVTYTVVVTNSGNVTVKDIALEDTLVNLTENAFTLAPAGTKTITYEYTVTQADVDAGKIDNTVTATGKDPKNKDVTGTANATVIAENAAAELSITKSANTTDNVKVGDTITYTVVVTNTGNVSVKDGKLADDHADLSAETFDLTPGASKTLTYTYKVVQGDIDEGKFTNTVTANATAVRGEDPEEAEAQSTVNAESANSSMSITKTANPTKDVAVGDEVTYTVVVKNTGNVTVKEGKLTDDHADLSAETFELAPNASKTFTYKYVVTQADVDAGQIVNNVKASAKAARGEGPKPVETTSVVKTVEKQASLNTVKTTTSKPANGKTYALGETINYKITVTNNGNVTISGVKVTDALTGDEWDAGTMAPNDKKEYTATHTVTEADIIKGSVANVAVAKGSDPQGEPTEGPGTKEDPTDPLDTTLTVNKAISNEPADGKAYKLGETIEYTITVTNNGNVTYTNVKVNDENTGFSTKIVSLAPGATETFTTSHVVDEADIKAGSYTNTVTAKGDPVKDEVPEGEDTVTTGDKDDPDGPNPPIEDLDTTLTVNKKIASQPADGKAYKLGEKIEYTITVTNDGNVTYTNVKVNDESTGFSTKIDSLAPGATETFTTSHVVNEDDILAGSYTNTVTAKADPVNGETPEGEDTVTTGDKDDPDGPNPPIEDLDTTLTVNKKITSQPADGKAYKLGEKIEYTITVTNDGNVTYKNVVVNDESTGLSKTIDSLAPGKTETFTTSHVVNEEDILAGSYTNTVTAKADPIKGETPEGEDTVTTGDKDDPDGPNPPIEPKNGHLSLKKETTSRAGRSDGKYVLGETIAYRITATNDGNLTLTDVKVVDELTNEEWTVASLAPGKTETFTTRHVVTEADILAGEVLNVATATVKSPDDDKPNPPVDPGEDPEPTEGSKPGISVTKTANRTRGFRQGDTVRYTITVRNTGNLTLTGVNVTDSLVKFAGNKGKNITLAPGASAKLTYNYTVTAANVRAGRVVNTATAQGTAPNGAAPTANDSVTVRTQATPGGGGNPAPAGSAPGGPGITPAAPADGDGAVVVPDEPVPEVEPEVDIEEPETPLAAGAWALVNLICAAVTALGAIVALFRKKEEDDEDEDEQNKPKTDDEDEDDNRGKKMLASKIAGAVAGVAAPIVFILTEDMSLPMQMFDKWTLLMAVILAAQVVAAIFNKKASELDDDEEEAEAAN